jgi:hypothetical protein
MLSLPLPLPPLLLLLPLQPKWERHSFFFAFDLCTSDFFQECQRSPRHRCGQGQ